MWLLEVLAGVLQALVPFRMTRRPAAVRESRELHPRSAVLETEVMDRTTNVEVVIADERGLSFVDAYGHEELRVPRVVRLELLPDDGFAGQRMIAHGENDEVEFWCPDSAGDAHALLSGKLPPP